MSGYDCRRCAREAASGALLMDRVHIMGRMFLCPTCGNKRCPKATDHRLDCTGSNEPGRAGSAYQDMGIEQKGEGDGLEISSAK